MQHLKLISNETSVQKFDSQFWEPDSIHTIFEQTKLKLTILVPSSQMTVQLVLNTTSEL